MWTVISKEVKDGVNLYQITLDGKVMSFRVVLERLSSSQTFIQFFVEILKSCPYEGFFWEVKPSTIHSLDEPFEFVLVKSVELTKIQADSTTFEEYFRGHQSVVTFWNLRKDAQLVVPAPLGQKEYYGHLALFVRNASSGQVALFFQKVAEAYYQSLGTEPIWLSTSGLGVSWLHVRIDVRPKYLRYLPYTQVF
jgi:hypothetical protein